MINTHSSDNILFYGGGLTLVTLFASLAIFGWLSIKYRNIRHFQFQMFVFIIIYIFGEILEDYKIPLFSETFPYLGSQIHIVAVVFLALILWLRLYYVRNSGRKTVDKLESIKEGDVGDADVQ